MPSGTLVGNINVSNEGDSAITGYTLSSTTDFNISSTGSIASVVSFDYETTTEYNLTVHATNSAGNSLEANITITINDILDTPITAVDGYIKEANVTDNLGQEANYTTNGQYTFASQPSYPITLTGGKLEDTNATFDINMSLTGSSSFVISPITTFIGTIDAIRGSLTNGGFSSLTTIPSFSVDYIATNDTNLSKLSQLLYVILRDTNLTGTFRQSVENNSSLGNLDNIFSLASKDINNSATLTQEDQLRQNSFINDVKKYAGTAANMEATLSVKAYKYNVMTANEANITHNGTAYGTVMSPYTGKIWLDRNLGASNVCNKNRDDGSFATDADYNTSQSSCYGDYYQWGREHDGHQEANSTITATLATAITGVGNSFITNPVSPYDWLDVNSNDVDDNGSLRSVNWSKIDGSSICPIGYRVPTETELTAETTGLSGTDDVVNRNVAFNNFLKLPSAGRRSSSGGSFSLQGSHGFLWSSSLSGTYSRYLHFTSNNAVWNSTRRTYGFSVRCVRD